MFQHPFHFRSILSPSSQFLHVLFKYIIHMSWTSQIRTVLIHFLWTNCGAPLCHHSDSLTQHLPCSSAPILILSEVPRAVATVFLFPDFFTLSSLIFFFFLHLLSLSYHLKVQLPAPCLGSLSVLIWLLLSERIPVTTLIFLLQINSLLFPISSSSS